MHMVVCIWVSSYSSKFTYLALGDRLVYSGELSVYMYLAGYL